MVDNDAEMQIFTDDVQFEFANAKDKKDALTNKVVETSEVK